MAGSVNIECPQVVGLAASIKAVREAMLAELEGANTGLEQDMRAVIAGSYPGSLPGRWNVEGETGGAAGKLASMRVSSDDQRVIWYEYGTGAHAIYPNVAQALHFMWARFGGQEVFFSHVAHPGTKPHNRREAIQQALEAGARTRYSAAIRAALAGLTTGE